MFVYFLNLIIILDKCTFFYCCFSQSPYMYRSKKQYDNLEAGNNIQHLYKRICEYVINKIVFHFLFHVLSLAFNWIQGGRTFDVYINKCTSKMYCYRLSLKYILLKFLFISSLFYFIYIKITELFTEINISSYTEMRDKNVLVNCWKIFT